MGKSWPAVTTHIPITFRSAFSSLNLYTGTALTFRPQKLSLHPTMHCGSLKFCLLLSQRQSNSLVRNYLWSFVSKNTQNIQTKPRSGCIYTCINQAVKAKIKATAGSLFIERCILFTYSKQEHTCTENCVWNEKLLINILSNGSIYPILPRSRSAVKLNV